MKKIFKLNLMAIFTGLLALSFSSCMLIFEEDSDDDVYHSASKGVVRILNCDSNRDAYIQKVEYWNEYTEEWNECWKYSESNTDSNISFKLKTGYYDFRIKVIYPLYDGYQDYYDIFTTDFDNPVYVSASYSKILKFDGKILSKE